MSPLDAPIRKYDVVIHVEQNEPGKGSTLLARGVAQKLSSTALQIHYHRAQEG